MMYKKYRWYVRAAGLFFIMGLFFLLADNFNVTLVVPFVIGIATYVVVGTTLCEMAFLQAILNGLVFCFLYIFFRWLSAFYGVMIVAPIACAVGLIIDFYGYTLLPKFFPKSWIKRTIKFVYNWWR